MEEGKFSTLAIHAGEPKPGFFGSVNVPIFSSTTYGYASKQDGDLPRYIRLNNTPNQEVLAKKIAALEGTESSVVAATGMAAISASLLALVPEGGHVIAQDSLYGGAYQFLKEDFSSLGRTVSFFKTEDWNDIQKHFRKETRAIYVESVSNPLLKIPDLKAITSWAKEKGLLTLVDNTFLSPVNFRPSQMGFDVTIHSATKYLNGHTDVIAGCASGEKKWIDKIRRFLAHLGGSLDPMSCYLLNRGMKTLALRVPAQCKTALEISSKLEGHPRVKKVLYPGLQSHLDHQRAKEWFQSFGGMFSFEFNGSVSETDAFLSRLKLPYNAPSLGGVETLVTRPALTSHSWMTSEERARLGISDSLVRVSIGLEDPSDLLHDFSTALEG